MKITYKFALLITTLTLCTQNNKAAPTLEALESGTYISNQPSFEEQINACHQKIEEAEFECQEAGNSCCICSAFFYAGMALLKTKYYVNKLETLRKEQKALKED